MELVIAEKPSVAKTIANVLGANSKNNGYFSGHRYMVSYCYGHLVELAKPEEYDECFKKWTYETLPIIPTDWKLNVIESGKKQFEILERLIHDANVTSIVCATDAGREGELIFRHVVNVAGCNKPIKRLWISSLEDAAIKKGFEELRDGNEFMNLYQAALSRQYADWLFGMNFTRLFTVLYKPKKALHIGRVQTPTLAMLCDREMEINNFVPTPYFVVHLTSDGIDAVSEKIEDKAQAEALLASVTSMPATVKSVEDAEKKKAQPKLYDLTTLQRDANKLFGFTAKKTLDIAQSLYEMQLTTYPRTDSQYLTDDMEDTEMRVALDCVSKMPFVPKEATYCSNPKLVLNSSKVTDHHAIIPTSKVKHTNLDKLSEDERKILFLVANRLLCATADVHVYSARKVVLECNGNEFKATGNGVIKNGWKEIDESFRKYMKAKKSDEEKENDSGESKNLNVTEGQVLNPASSMSNHMTKAPARYTEASLLSAMEKVGNKEMSDDVERKGLGTPATRADIIESLVKNGFASREKKNLIPTEDGIKLITIVPDALKSPGTTVEWENMLCDIAKGTSSHEEFDDGIQNMVRSIVSQYNAVSDENKNLFSKDAYVIGACPKCGANILDGKYGAYCEAKCGMMLGKVRGHQLTVKQLKSLLAGEKILVRGLKSKKGHYDAYFIPDGIEEFSYTNRNGEQASGWQFKTEMEFPKKF